MTQKKMRELRKFCQDYYKTNHECNSRTCKHNSGIHGCMWRKVIDFLPKNWTDAQIAKYGKKSSEYEEDSQL